MESDFENDVSDPTYDINCNDNEIDDEVVNEVDNDDCISDNDSFVAVSKKKFSLNKLREQNETCSLVIKSNKVKRRKVFKTKAPFSAVKRCVCFKGVLNIHW